MPRVSSSTAQVTAADLSAALDQLRIRGLLAQQIDEVDSDNDGSASASKGVFKGVKPKSLQVFSRQFATMIDAGMNVVSALGILEEQTERRRALAGDRRSCARTSRAGCCSRRRWARHPKVFSRLYVAMVEAGEAAGILDIVLDRVALQIEKEQMIKRRVKGAMVYPTIVLIFATLVLNGMLLFLVPIFTKIFAQLNGQLPTLTQYVVKVSDLLRERLVHHLPRLRPVDLRRDPLQAHRARAAGSGTGRGSAYR